MCLLTTSKVIICTVVIKERDVALVVRWVEGSIIRGEPIELCLVPASATRLVYVLFCLWDDAYKGTIAANRKDSPCGGSGFPFSLSEWSFTICLTPYSRKYVLNASLNKNISLKRGHQVSSLTSERSFTIYHALYNLTKCIERVVTQDLSYLPCPDIHASTSKK